MVGQDGIEGLGQSGEVRGPAKMVVSGLAKMEVRGLAKMGVRVVWPSKPTNHQDIVWTMWIRAKRDHWPTRNMFSLSYIYIYIYIYTHQLSILFARAPHTMWLRPSHAARTATKEVAVKL